MSKVSALYNTCIVIPASELQRFEDIDASHGSLVIVLQNGQSLNDCLDIYEAFLEDVGKERETRAAEYARMR